MKFAFTLFATLFVPGFALASVVITNGLSHTHTLSGADGKTQGVIRVRNEGSKESRILIYRQDMVTECGKPADYPETGSHSRSLGSMLKTNVDEKLLEAAEEYEIRYNIDLASQKASPGTYWEVIMVEVADPIREEPRNGVQVSSKVRYAIQVILDVGDFEGPQLSYENVAFEKISDKQSALKVQIKNNGMFGARTNVMLEIYDATGNKLKVTEPSSRMLYPGFCTTFEIPVADLPKGKYDCVIVADTKKDLFGSNVTLQID